VILTDNAFGIDDDEGGIRFDGILGKQVIVQFGQEDRVGHFVFMDEFADDLFVFATFTPRTTIVSLSFWESFCNLGISMRHGPHQVAQKSSSTILPLNEVNSTWLPSRLGSLKLGAVLPIG